MGAKDVDTQTATRRVLRRASRVVKGSLIAAGALSISGLVAISAAMVCYLKLLTLEIADLQAMSCTRRTESKRA